MRATVALEAQHFRQALAIALLVCVFVGVVCVPGSPAFAQTADTPTPMPAQSPAQSEEVDALVREGIELRKAQREAEALERFEQAYARAPLARIEAQMGLAERSLRKWVAAERHLRRALAVHNDEWIEKNREPLSFGLTTVEKHLGWLTVETNVDGAELWIDGVRVGTLPQREPVRVGEGPNAIEVRAKGHSADPLTINVVPGERMRVLVAMRVDASPPDTTQVPQTQIAPSTNERKDPPTRGSSSTMRIVGYSLAGVGVAGIVTGTIFGLMTISAKNGASDCTAVVDPTQKQQCNDHNQKLNTDGHTDSDVANYAFIAGGVALAGGVVLVLLNPPSSSSASSPHGLRIDPILGPSLAGARIGGSF